MPLLEKGKISANQLLFLLLDYIISGAVIFNIGNEMEQDAWLAVLLGITLSLGFALLYLKLSNIFQGKTLVEINKATWGPWLGGILNFVYLLFFTLVTFMAISSSTKFQKEFLINTPQLSLSLLETGIAVLLAVQGLEVLARCTRITRIFTTVIWGFLVLLNLPETKITYFQPVMQTPLPQLFQASLRASAFTFGIGFSFLMIFPVVRDFQKNYATTTKAFAISSFYLMTNTLFAVGVLGPATRYFPFQVLHASRLINVGEVFTRMEVLTGIILWLGGFFNQTILIYILIMIAGELLKLKSVRTLSIPIWLLLSLLSLYTFASSNDDLEFAMNVYPRLIVPFQYFLPLVTLVAAVIRRLPGKEV